MTEYYDLARFEEGWRAKPYIDSLGYPTVGFGFRIGPKYSLIKHYEFTLPLSVGEVWLAEFTLKTIEGINQKPRIKAALQSCLEADKKTVDSIFESPRASVILSMCHQMGVEGVDQFTNTLKYITHKMWSNAEAAMLDSLWAKQTPNRAKRHAAQMRTGVWAKEY